jgi:hypothetical protein
VPDKSPIVIDFFADEDKKHDRHYNEAQHKFLLRNRRMILLSSAGVSMSLIATAAFRRGRQQ